VNGGTLIVHLSSFRQNEEEAGSNYDKFTLAAGCVRGACDVVWEAERATRS